MKTKWIRFFCLTGFVCDALSIDSLLQYPLLGSGNICVDRKCKDPPTLPATLSTVVLGSPLTEVIMPDTYEKLHHHKMDNICYTFFKIGDKLFITIQSGVTVTGKNIWYIHFEVDVKGRLGVLAGADPTCTYKEFAIKLGCGLSVVIYRCFEFGDCKKDFVPIDHGYDSFHVLSLLYQTTSLCQEILIKEIQALVGFNVTGLVALPNKLNKQCITELNGMKCIGHSKVDKKDSKSINTLDSSLDVYKEQFNELFGTMNNTS